MDQWLLFGLIVVAILALLTIEPEQWLRYVSPPLIAGAIFRAIRSRGGPPDSG